MCIRDSIHVEGSIDPARDIETINLELILSDVEMLERKIDRTQKMLKGDKKYHKYIDSFSYTHLIIVSILFRLYFALTLAANIYKMHNTCNFCKTSLCSKNSYNKSLMN